MEQISPCSQIWCRSLRRHRPQSESALACFAYKEVNNKDSLHIKQYIIRKRCIYSIFCSALYAIQYYFTALYITWQAAASGGEGRPAHDDRTHTPGGSARAPEHLFQNTCFSLASTRISARLKPLHLHLFHAGARTRADESAGETPPASPARTPYMPPTLYIKH